MERLAEYERDHEFLRLRTFPEEDRNRYTSATWAGEYRWFRSPNIVCLVKVRALLVRNERRDSYGAKMAIWLVLTCVSPADAGQT
jgi:hypothetical protein